MINYMLHFNFNYYLFKEQFFKINNLEIIFNYQNYIKYCSIFSGKYVQAFKNLSSFTLSFYFALGSHLRITTTTTTTTVVPR